MLSKGELRGALLALGGLVVLVLLIAKVTPGLPGELLLQSLQFHIALAGVVIALLAMALGARWRGLLGLILVLAFGIHGALLVKDLQLRRTEIAATPAATFDFLSFNVLTGNPRYKDLVDAIISDPPDIALIMETPGIETELGRLAPVLPYRVGCDQTSTCDISLLSRFPLEDAEVVNLPPFGRERLVIARTAIEGQKVTVVGLHLSKPYFDNAAWRELDAVQQAISGIEGPLLLAGDFNSAPWSNPVVWLAVIQDLVPGPWPPATWPVRLGPLGIPIDNVFTRGNARLLSLEAGDNLGSNHRPLRAQVALYPES